MAEKTKLHKNLSPTFCPLPFLGIYGSAKGEVVPCCESQETVMSRSGEAFRETWNNEHYRDLRTALLAGERPQICWKCWENEDNGQFSNREQALADLEDGFFGRQDFQVDGDGRVSSFPAFLELKPSNVCNLKCRMCSPESSFRISEDREIIDEYRSGWNWSEKPFFATQLFEDLLNGGDEIASRLRVLQYSGGEPLVSEEQYRLTSSLADKFGHQIELRYATNLTQLKFEKYRIVDLWKKFKFVHVKISADGVFDVYDYIRVGAKFEKMVDNIKAIQDMNLPNVRMMIGFTTQAYNIFQLPETFDFFRKLMPEVIISSHLLYTPWMMSVEVLPEEYRERVLKKLEFSKWDFSSKIDYLNENIYGAEQADRWLQLTNYTQAMEKRHGIQQGFLHLLEKYTRDYS